MPDPEYKTLADMTDAELKHVAKEYELRDQINKLDPVRINHFHDFFKKEVDLLRNRERIESLSSWFCIEVFQDVLAMLLASKGNLSIFSALTLSILAVTLIPLTWMTVVMALTLYFTLTMAFFLLTTNFQLQLHLQVELEKSFKLKPKILNNSTDTEIQYNIHARNPGKKIYKSLTYGETVGLIFSKFSKYRIQQHRDCYNLLDGEDNVRKSWDSEADLIRQQRP